MPRQVIIGVLVVLIVGVLGGTVAIIVNRLGLSSATSNESGAQANEDLVVSGGEDIDGDGLSNIEESRWGTDPNNVDTDGDGFEDGAEVEARHNPTIAGPNDALPDGFQIAGSASVSSKINIAQLSLEELLESLQTKPSVVEGSKLVADQYMQEGFNPRAAGPNLTEVYNAQTGEGQSNESLNAFVKTQIVTTVLPVVNEENFAINESAESLDMQTYLTIANDEYALAGSELIGRAFTDLVEDDNTRLVEVFVSVLQAYRAELLTVAAPVPSEAVELHRLLLAYTDTLSAAFQKTLLWDEDKIGALASIRQIDALDRIYYPLIQAEIDRLESE